MPDNRSMSSKGPELKAVSEDLRPAVPKVQKQIKAGGSMLCSQVVTGFKDATGERDCLNRLHE